ncbi:MAG: hypothetical protein HRT89_19795 [Lentisphaeria bacterium]|nr:hypothetical protein [Lentisphaeria bacterium]NQZ70301.1 hypothetical protein [Lentisphaeria bacterium]
MKHKPAHTRFKNIKVNLPVEVQSELNKIEESGWQCSYFVAVLDNVLVSCILAERPGCRYVVYSDSIESLINDLLALVMKQYGD